MHIHDFNAVVTVVDVPIRGDVCVDRARVDGEQCAVSGYLSWLLRNGVV